jgi:hypothetical protein
MGALSTISKYLRPPKLEDLTGAPGQVKEKMQMQKMNTIDVIYLDRDFRAGDQVSGTVQRKGIIDTVHIKSPGRLGFWKTGTFFNRTTGKTMMLAVEGYPFGLDINRELEMIEQNDHGSGELEKGESYKMPILIEKLPYTLEKQKAKEKLKQLSDDNYFELTPDLVEGLGNSNLVQGINEEDHSVVPITLLIGALLGAVGAFAWIAGMSGGKV